MQKSGIKRIVFAGADEVAEIAYITLQETTLELAGVVDGEHAGEKFFGREIQPFSAVKQMQYDSVVVTTYLKRDAVAEELTAHGVAKEALRGIF